MKSTRIGERMSAKLSIFYPNPTSSPLFPPPPPPPPLRSIRSIHSIPLHQ